MYFSRKPLRFPVCAGWLFAAFFLLNSSPVFGEDLDECRKLFLKGEYTEVIRQATHANESAWDEQWPLLLSKAHLAVGNYPDASTIISAALLRFNSSIQLRLAGHEVFNANGQTNRADQMLGELAAILEGLSSGARGSRLRSIGEPANMTALGQALLIMKAEPKLILENFFDQVKRVDPNYREAWLAAGELALNKHDYKLAADSFGAALKKFPDDPDAQFGLARAFAPSDPLRHGKAVEAVLDYNPRHVPAMLLLVDHLVDAEEYEDADEMLDRAFKVNPWNPEAWAYRAVLAHLRGNTNAELSARTNALKFWRTNPQVDHLIGAKLSQNYRFAEGAAHQRRALGFDADYLPAKIQLAQDLLRLGDETEGWRLAAEVHEQDGYDVTAYNLVTLHDVIGKYRTLTNQDFIVRMHTNEAAIYGDRVLELLQKAKDTLSAKYGLRLDRPTVVEIFNEQKDFGVRTFGMPHNPGFLGVCFGHVVTANSPAAQSGHPENWEAVLWHEFCHVITLGLTRNKMPRWLSEGISVYEERQANPVWGQSMNPRYREMILGGELTPVGELSSAFMSPKTPYHIQFAYFESSLVVEYIIGKFGIEPLKKILADLGNGVYINDALARHTVPLDRLEKDFAAFAREKANNLAPGLDWRRPGPVVTREGGVNIDQLNDVVDDFIKRLLRNNGTATNAATTNIASTNTVAATNLSGHTNTAVAHTNTSSGNNYWELLMEASDAFEEKKWAEAKSPLKKLIELYPNQTGDESAYLFLALAHRQLGETNEERQVLIKLASLEAGATEAYLRLMELGEANKDWSAVTLNAERFLAVNPLVPQPYRHLARASEATSKPEPAIRSYQRMLLLDPPDPADVHYKLARLLRQKGDTIGAKRHVLQALEEAPRFPDALKLLLEIQGDAPAAQGTGSMPAK